MVVGLLEEASMIDEEEFGATSLEGSVARSLHWWETFP
jgi:hypothetical protein